MKVKISEDVQVAVGTDAPVDLKAGTITVTEKNQAAVNVLLENGQAEIVKDKGE